MAEVVILPVTHTLRAFLDLQALRIAAHTSKATYKVVISHVYQTALAAGASEAAAQAEVERAIAWIKARLRQIEDLRASHPPIDRGSSCAKG